MLIYQLKLFSTFSLTNRQELTLQQVKDSVDVMQPPRNTRPCPEGLLMKYQEQVDEEEDELIWYYQRDQESKQEQTQVVSDG